MENQFDLQAHNRSLKYLKKKEKKNTKTEYLFFFYAIY